MQLLKTHSHTSERQGNVNLTKTHPRPWRTAGHLTTNGVRYRRFRFRGGECADDAFGHMYFAAAEHVQFPTRSLIGKIVVCTC